MVLHYCLCPFIIKVYLFFLYLCTEGCVTYGPICLHALLNSTYLRNWCQFIPNGNLKKRLKKSFLQLYLVNPKVRFEGNRVYVKEISPTMFVEGRKECRVQQRLKKISSEDGWPRSHSCRKRATDNVRKMYITALKLRNKNGMAKIYTLASFSRTLASAFSGDICAM